MARGLVAASNQYLETPDSSILRTPTTAISIGVWVKAVGSSDNYAAVIQKGWDNWASTDPWLSYNVGHSANARKFQASISDGTPGGLVSTVETSTLTANLWYYLIMYWKTGNKLSMRVLNSAGTIIQRVQSAATVSMTIGYDSTSLRIGRGDNAADFDGHIAEPTIWNANTGQTQHVALAKGWPVHNIRPQYRVFHAPLLRDEDADHWGGAVLTPYGSPTIETHARVMGVARSPFPGMTGSAPPTGFLPYPRPRGLRGGLHELVGGMC